MISQKRLSFPQSIEIVSVVVTYLQILQNNKYVDCCASQPTASTLDKIILKRI